MGEGFLPNLKLECPFDSKTRWLCLEGHLGLYFERLIPPKGDHRRLSNESKVGETLAASDFTIQSQMASLQR